MDIKMAIKLTMSRTPNSQGMIVSDSKVRLDKNLSLTPTVEHYREKKA